MSNYLTRSQVRKLSKRLRAKGRNLPRVGWCQNISDVAKAKEVCHYRNGYTFVGTRLTNTDVLSGARRR